MSPLSPDRPRLPLLVRTALLGLATGGRSSAPFAGLAWTSNGADPAPFDLLASRRGRIAAALFAGGELVFDKLPFTPSRLRAFPLAGRVLGGALGGIGLACRSGAVPVRALPASALLPGALVGGAVALAGGYLGAGFRRRASFGSDLPPALLEDAAVAIATYVACSPTSDR